MTENRPLPQRFHSLDALRGIAALCIVIFHWPFFFCDQPAPCNAGRLPFYSVMWPIYVHGWRAVDIFFALSGFIFCWLYAQRIADHKMRAREFFVLRFSRLYPLHFATLIFVAAAQGIAMTWHGAPLMCHVNDLYHFALQLFFASNWGFEKECSFNGPVWSVSVEVLLYVLFFILCKVGLRRWWVFLLVALCSLKFSDRFHMVERGFLSFFAGVLSFMLFSFVHRRSLAFRFFAISSVLLVAGCTSAFLLRTHDVYSVYRGIFGTRCVLFGHDVIGAALLILHGISFRVPLALVVYPCLIVWLALIETYRGTLGRRLAFLGDMSYSMYLLHFPLQIIVVFGALYFRMDWSRFYEPVGLFLFLAVLLPASWLSCRYFEKPVQRFLRKRLGAARSGAPAVAARQLQEAGVEE